MRRSNAGLFWPVLVLVTAIDFCTKAIAANRLQSDGLPHDVFGEWMRFTLVYNPGAAFGLHVGEYSRWIFMVLTVVALVILGRLYAATRPGDVDSHVLARARVRRRARQPDRPHHVAARRGRLHRHRLRRLAVADVQRRRHGGEHRRVPARLGAVGRGHASPRACPCLRLRRRA